MVRCGGLVTGGKRATQGGTFFEPTVLTHVTTDMVTHQVQKKGAGVAAPIPTAKRFRLLLFDQGIISMSMDNSIPSQNKNARTIDASSAPSKPHSSFVGSRFSCQAEVPSLKSAGKSGMTIFPFTVVCEGSRM